MKRILSILLSLVLAASLSAAALAEEHSSGTVAEARIAYPVIKGSETPPDKQTTYFRYTPEDFKFRGNSTPVIFVLGDGAWTAETAADTLTRGGFDQMAQEESGHIVFVSPSNGTSWTEEDYTVMQALATNVTDDYTYTLEQAGTYDTGVTEDGVMYAGRFRSYTFAEGSAQEFVKTYLDTPDSTYLVQQWNNVVDGFSAAYHYADAFERTDNLSAWHDMRRINRISLSDGVTYLDKYYVYSDYGIRESIETFTSSKGNTMEYYQYVPKGVDVNSKTEKYPLVLVSHGSNQHPEGYVQLTNWPIVADQENFIVVAINAHNLVNTDEILELVDFMIDQRAVDASRVYATGYSIGGMKSWTLGFERPDRFAAIAPTEGIPGMGKVSLPDPDRSIPTFWVAGEKEFYNLFPMNSEAAIAIIQQLANANGFAYNGIYDESLGKYYGMKTDKTYTYCPRPAHSDNEAVMTIHEMKSKDGNVYTILTSVSEMGHSAYPDSAQRMWAFFRQFSRNSDGSLAANPLPLVSDVSANAWYADAVRHVLDNGMMTANGTFSPNAPLTAGDLAQALYIRAGSPTEGVASWTKAAGIPTGSAAVTRDELAKAIRACAAYKGKAGADPADAGQFQDGDIASQDALWAASNGIFSGKKEGRLDASAQATRAEGAQALTRLSIFLAQ